MAVRTLVSSGGVAACKLASKAAARVTSKSVARPPGDAGRVSSSCLLLEHHVAFRDLQPLLGAPQLHVVAARFSQKAHQRVVACLNRTLPIGGCSLPARGAAAKQV